MESGFFFTAAVIGVGVLHLVWQAATCIHRKTAHQATSKPVKNHESTRPDWYMFFFRSDITGKEARQISPTTPKSDHTSRRQTKTKKRRSAQRMQLS